MSDVATTADWVTAAATCAAAIGTVGALLYASKAARAASRSATAASDAAANETLPLLLDVPYEHFTDYEHEYPWPEKQAYDVAKTPMRGLIRLDHKWGTFSIPVRNVGRGVARIESYEISIARSGESYAQYGAEAIPVGEDRWLAGKPVPGSPFAEALHRVPSPLHDEAPIIFTVTYTDNVGDQRQHFEMMLGSRGDGAWRVIRTNNRPIATA